MVRNNSGFGKNSLFAEERKIKILDIVRQNKKTTVGELCNVFIQLHNPG